MYPDEPMTDRVRSIPEVFDEIADVARDVHEQSLAAEARPASPGPISAGAKSADEQIGVDVVEGRVTSIDIDAFLTETVPWVDLEPRVLDVVNEALKNYEAAQMEVFKAVNADFGGLVEKLHVLQADVHTAFMDGVRRVGGVS
jgi:hypothetical protein